MVAIFTKYIGPTNFKGSRVKAYTDQGEHSLNVTIAWNDVFNAEYNHKMAAYTLASKMKWRGKWVGGGTKNGFAFVNTRAAYCSFQINAEKGEVL